MANTKKYVSLDKLGLYDKKIKGVISAGDAATLASAEAAAKAYADGLASNYDAAGAAATALTDAKSYTDTEVAKANSAAAEAKTQADKGVADAAAADAKAVKAQEEVDALEGVVAELEAYVGDIPEDYTQETVIAYINKKAEETLAAAQGGSSETAASVKAQLDTYKSENDAAVAAVDGKADAAQTAADNAQAAADAAQEDVDTLADTHATDKAALEAEDARIVGLVEAEAERAAGVEDGLNDRLTEVEAFFKLAEGESLDTALDTLVEIQTYITSEGSAADQMVLDIAANTKAIEDMDAAYKAADTTINGRLDTLEAIDHDAYKGADSALKTELEGKINAKADSSVVEAMDTAYKAADTELSGRLDDVEAALGTGEGSVSDQIADAKQEAIDSAVATAAADATTKANAAETNAKGYADGLNTAMDSRMSVVEGKAHEHSNKALLDTYTQTEENLADAVAKKHEHSNLSVLEGITSAKVTEWDKVSAKADQTALQAEIDRAKAAEEANAAAIALFVEVSEQEINDLFA